MQLTDVGNWLSDLEKQRRLLKMSYRVLADKSGVSLATIRRVLKARKTSSSLDSVLAIAGVLGAAFEVKIEDPEKVVERQILTTARDIAMMVQGTMALESQGTTDPKHIEALVEIAAREMRAKPRKRIWIRQCRSSKSSPAKPQSLTSPS
jgi:transcriptional regulator with XRE-family HTH domain